MKIERGRHPLGRRRGAGREPTRRASTSCASIRSASLTAPWLGYNSLRYGRAGVERVYNEELSGQSGLLGVTSYWERDPRARPSGEPTSS